MKSCYVGIVTIFVSLAYSAPLEYEYVSIEEDSSKPMGQQNLDAASGTCCQPDSPKCCPYDYDDRCGIENNRTLCGYNKNQKKTDEESNVTLYGLPCRVNDDRLECGYNGPYITDRTTNTNNIPNSNSVSIKNNSNCCHCCDKEVSQATATTTRTTSTTTTTTTKPATVTTTTAITTTETTTTTQKKEKSTKYQKLDFRSTKQPEPPCATVEERCVITYESPCIMNPPCSYEKNADTNEKSDDSDD